MGVRERLSELDNEELLDRRKNPTEYRDEWGPGDRGDPHGRARFSKLVVDEIARRLSG